MASQQIVCYIPVVHQGYLEFFASYPDADIYALTPSVLASRFDYLRKDIRALKPADVTMLLNGMGRNATVVETESQVKNLMKSNDLIMPDDDISHALADEFGATQVTFVPVFLRWDRTAIDTNQDIRPDRTEQVDSTDPIATALYSEAAKSTNWWRNVGAGVVVDGKVISSGHNTPVPTEYSSVIHGDPRILAGRGANIDISIDIHAEASAIGTAAKQGLSLSGAAIYVTTFPCPTCAKLIAASGIRQCYFIEGYATVDGQSILKANAIEIIKIDTDATPSHTRQRPKTYPSA